MARRIVLIPYRSRSVRKASLFTYCGNQAMPCVLTPLSCTLAPWASTRSVPETCSRPCACTGVTVSACTFAGAAPGSTAVCPGTTASIASISTRSVPIQRPTLLFIHVLIPASILSARPLCQRKRCKQFLDDPLIIHQFLTFVYLLFPSGAVLKTVYQKTPDLFHLK